jgi:hypothetical protein
MGTKQPTRAGAWSATTHVEDRSERASRFRPGAFDAAPGVHRVPLPLPSDGLCAVDTHLLGGDPGPVHIHAGWVIREPRVLLPTRLGHVGYCFLDAQRILARHSTEYFPFV